MNFLPIPVIPLPLLPPVKYLVREVIDSHGELSHKAELGRWLWLPGCPTHPPAASRCLFAMAMLTAPLPQRTPKALHRRLLQQHKHPRYWHRARPPGCDVVQRVLQCAVKKTVVAKCFCFYIKLFHQGCYLIFLWCWEKWLNQTRDLVGGIHYVQKSIIR